MSDGGYIADPISLFTDEIIRQNTGRYIQIPRKLKLFLDDNVSRPRGREVAASLYSFIEMKSGELKESFAGLKQRKKSNDWTKINHKSFAGLGSTATVTRYKKLLVEHGFIKQNDKYSAGRFSKSYKIKKYSDYVEQELRKINFLDLIETSTASDPACKFTRSCIGRLKFNPERIKAVIQENVFEKIDQHLEGFQGAVNRIRPTKYPVIKICGNRGTIKRDEYGRLHSPFTQLKGDYRKLFTVDNQELISADMVSCHPTIIGLMSGDNALIRDCNSGKDSFYKNVMECLAGAGLPDTRDDAKKAGFKFIYGPNREERTKTNRVAWAVKDLFERKYKIAAKYIWDFNTRNPYAEFARELQRRESFIFIDELLNIFRKQKIFCLTVHDGIYFKAEDKSAVKSIMNDNLVNIINKRNDVPIEQDIVTIKWTGSNHKIFTI